MSGLTVVKEYYEDFLKDCVILSGKTGLNAEKLSIWSHLLVACIEFSEKNLISVLSQPACLPSLFLKNSFVFSELKKRLNKALRHGRVYEERPRCDLLLRSSSKTLKTEKNGVTRGLNKCSARIPLKETTRLWTLEVSAVSTKHSLRCFVLIAQIPFYICPLFLTIFQANLPTFLVNLKQYVHQVIFFWTLEMLQDIYTSRKFRNFASTSLTRFAYSTSK